MRAKDENKRKTNGEDSAMPPVEINVSLSNNVVPGIDVNGSTHFNSQIIVEHEKKASKRKCYGTDCKKDPKKQVLSPEDLSKEKTVCDDVKCDEYEDSTWFERNNKEEDYSSSELFDNQDDLEIINSLASKYCYERLCEESDNDSIAGSCCNEDGEKVEK